MTSADLNSLLNGKINTFVTNINWYLRYDNISSFGECRDYGRDTGEALGVNDGSFRPQKLCNSFFQLQVNIQSPIKSWRATINFNYPQVPTPYFLRASIAFSLVLSWFIIPKKLKLEKFSLSRPSTALDFNPACPIIIGVRSNSCFWKSVNTGTSGSGSHSSIKSWISYC